MKTAPLALALLASVSVFAQAPGSGQRIYRQQCADCHGQNGEGTPQHYSQALTGDLSVAQLSRVIARTMPEGEAEMCQGEDARAVAAYIHRTFYSPAAQARLNPPRVELSRLSARQHQNALADLIESFLPSGPRWDRRRDSERGLKAEYFGDRRFRKDRVERLDPQVDFDWKDKSPMPEKKIPAKEFSIRWSGSLAAPETGDYEIGITVGNGAKLHLNDRETPLIDAWVRSGDSSEYRRTVRLLGGRVYALELELFKYKEKNAAVRLFWKRPHHAEETIPSYYLRPWKAALGYVPTVDFPPDDRSQGYVRGAAVSPEWDRAATQAALETAAFASEHLEDLSGCKNNDPNRAKKLRAFAERFVEKAFRRPLDETQKKRYIERAFASTEDPALAVKRIVLLTLKSPRFLWREIEGGGDGWNVASRLAFGLWDSPPDERLLTAARENRLQTPKQVLIEARRMTNDPRAAQKMREFFRHWLKMEEIEDLTKDSKRHPNFTPEVLSDMRSSLERTLDAWLSESRWEFRELLLSEAVYLNPRLAKFYGREVSTGSEFQKIALEDGRAGVLTHPFLLTGLAYSDASSPIHRGVFVARSLLGRRLKPPPEAVTPLPPKLHPDLTTRQRIALQTKPAACARCHELINPLGFSLEQFDAVGRFRKEENGRPIDAVGFYRTAEDQRREFKTARELAEFLAESPEAHAALVEQLFQHAAQQPLFAYGLDQPEKLRRIFQQQQLDVRSLLAAVAAASSLPPQGASQ